VAIGKICNRHDASRGPLVIAELLVSSLSAMIGLAVHMGFPVL